MENKNIVAFVGLYSFDIILYLSRILLKVGRKVLVVDNSETFALTLSIPQIAELDTNQNYLTYRRVDFTSMGIDEKTTELYDDILIDCGVNAPKYKTELSTRIIYVTDLFDFNIKRLQGITYYDEIKTMKKLLIRDAINTKLTTEYLIDKMKKNITPGMVTVLYREESDYENSLLCHYNKVFRFTHISKMMKEYLINEVQSLLPNYQRKEILAAYQKAKKGD